MNKFLLFTGCLLLLSRTIFSQDSLSIQKSGNIYPYTPTPLIIIKGDAFRRFPSGNFLDAVNGLFPGVFSQTQGTDDFVFVVNGFLLADINSISLNDIEEVSFSRNSLDGSLYPFSRAGTFYITTRKLTGLKTSFNFNTQSNLIWQSDKATSVHILNGPVETKEIKNRPGYSLSNHLSALTGGKKWELYTSVQLNQTTLPKGTNTSILDYPGIRLQDSAVTTGGQKQINIASFAQFTYRFSSRLHAGISGSYFHGTTNSDTSLSEYYYPDMRGNAVAAIKTTLPYYHTGAFVYWTPLHNLSNQLSFEYAADRLRGNNEGAAIGFSLNDPNLSRTTTVKTTTFSKRLLLRDELKYSFLTTSKFNAGVKAIFSYLNQKQEYKNDWLSLESNGVASAANQLFSSSQKITSLNPGFYFSYNKIISGYGGYAFMLNKGGSVFTGASKSNPYAGLVFDVKKMTKQGGKLDRLDVSIDYASLLKNNSNDNWLPGIDHPSQFVPSPILAAYPASSSSGAFKLGLQKNSLIAVQVNAAFFNNRLLAGAAFTKQHTDNLYHASFVYVNIPESQKALSVYIATMLINKPLKTWMVRLNMLASPHATYSLNNVPNPYIISLRDQLQVGLQNSITCKNWYAQIQGLMALNNRTVNTYVINYLLIGYHFSGPPGALLQKTGVFVQARNLLSSGSSRDYYGYYTYGGVGVNLTF